jgi:ribosome-binding protein aMBF1 (putative translation factor)
MEVPDLVYRVRRHLGLTQVDLGIMVGRRGETVSRWERGLSSPSKKMITELERLARR